MPGASDKRKEHGGELRGNKPCSPHLQTTLLRRPSSQSYDSRCFFPVRDLQAPTAISYHSPRHPHLFRRSVKPSDSGRPSDRLLAGLGLLLSVIHICAASTAVYSNTYHSFCPEHRDKATASPSQTELHRAASRVPLNLEDKAFLPCGDQRRPAQIPTPYRQQHRHVSTWLHPACLCDLPVAFFSCLGTGTRLTTSTLTVTD